MKSCNQQDCRALTVISESHYIGDGQETFEADNTHYYRQNTYQVEYYFTTKNESNEASIEDALLEAGYLYEKSEDVYIEDQNVFVIYYNI